MSEALQQALTSPQKALAIDLVDLLREAGNRVDALGAGFEPDQRQMESLRRRLREERCHLAVLGQFKRGKSTLVNALLGAPVLPAAVVPLTSIPTFLHAGEQLTAQVVFENGTPDERFIAGSSGALAEFIARFVTEACNPHNRLGVRWVNVTYPASVLRHGLALIDTPGIGSTYRHNTEATMNFLPQCDAAIFVVSADPPITEVEVEFLKLAHRRVARLFFILNKVDYLDADERKAAVAFLQQVLCEQVGFADPPPIYCTSARKGLTARQVHDAAAWQNSGLAEVEHRIVNFLLTEKTDVLRRAISQQAGDLLADVQRRLELTRRSLELPLAELDERMRSFEEHVTKIEEQRIVALERLGGDEHRLTESVRTHVADLLPLSRKFLHGIIQSCADQSGDKWSEDPTREAIAAAIPGFFEHEFGMAHQRCEQELRAALLPHRRHMEELIASVHRLVEQLFDVPFEPPKAEIVLATSEQPYWRTHKWTIAFGSIPVTWIDRMVPQRLRYLRIHRRLMEQVEYLATRNVGDLQWSMLENLKGSVQSFRHRLNTGLQQAIDTTRRALDVAFQRRTDGSATAAPEIAYLRSAVADIQELRGRVALLGSKTGGQHE